MAISCTSGNALYLMRECHGGERTERTGLWFLSCAYIHTFRDKEGRPIIPLSRVSYVSRLVHIPCSISVLIFTTGLVRIRIQIPLLSYHTQSLFPKSSTRERMIVGSTRSSRVCWLETSNFKPFLILNYARNNGVYVNSGVLFNVYLNSPRNIYINILISTHSFFGVSN